MTLPIPRVQLTGDQQALYDEVVQSAVARYHGDYASVLVAYARGGADPQDVEAVRWALFGPWRPTSRDAVTSLVAGVLAVFVCPVPLLGVVAIWAANAALKETRTGIKDGQGMAQAGSILGWINTAFWVGLAVLMVAALLIRRD